MSRGRFYYLLVIFFHISFLALFSACGAKPTAEKREISFNTAPKEKPPLLSYLNRENYDLSSSSAFYSLSNPSDALAARIFLIEHAQTTLDIQYYIYEKDRTGKYFSHKLLQAAKRGVKIRILIDDLSTTDKDKDWVELASHPNIELRLFNPNSFRTYFRNMALLFNVGTLGKRMHNKSLTADGCATIIGGRNIGDVYFAVDEKTLFIDYDVLGIGEIVPEIYNHFDIYWNSPHSITYKKVLDTKAIRYRDKTDDNFDEKTITQTMKSSNFIKEIDSKKFHMTIADNTSFYFDLPDKVSTPDEDTRDNISTQIDGYLDNVKNNLIIISAYFIPSDKLLENLKDLTDRGVDITIITNSLASTDVSAVYSGYKNSIETLLRMNINLYEIKAVNFKKLLKSKSVSKHSQASLHTKMMIIDDKYLLVGSANIDNRSNKLNTEIVLIIESQEFVKKKKTGIFNALNANYFYKLELEELPPFDIDYGIPRVGITWHTLEGTEEKIYYSIPNTGFWKTFGTNILSYLPIEGYL